jgi:hypothetical protein
MALESFFREAMERINTEYVILFSMLIPAVYIIYESYDFQAGSAAIFPRIMAVFVVVGSVLLLLRPVLPEPLYSIVTDESQLIDVEDDDELDEPLEEIEEEEDEDEALSAVGRPIPDSVFAAGSAIAYGLAGYAVGLLWVTPLFVLVYGIWFKLSWRVLAVIVPLSFMIGFGFMEFVNIPVDRGEIFNRGGL